MRRAPCLHLLAVFSLFLAHLAARTCGAAACLMVSARDDHSPDLTKKCFSALHQVQLRRVGGGGCPPGGGGMLCEMSCCTCLQMQHLLLLVDTGTSLPAHVDLPACSHTALRGMILFENGR